MIEQIVFDWGDTVMCDSAQEGPMKDWPQVAYIPHVEPALKQLSARFSLCIATSAGHSDTAAMIAALKRVGADRYFKYFYSAFDLGVEKPDPEFFTAVAKASGFAPQSCIMVGNLYQKDIVGAKAVGMKTVLFHATGNNGDFPDADRVIDTMLDLVNTINEIVDDE